eukprot:TRINITY_DN399_c0_g1_i3.p1 TRINITY_DN399_c0_g1~~TRINITY_DN399_c0_g1_i3.p1  ORF type:complete len:135 (+),score=9.58 TRINITY_DN399_c0_g1_i3:248-652(+)
MKQLTPQQRHEAESKVEVLLKEALVLLKDWKSETDPQRLQSMIQKASETCKAVNDATQLLNYGLQHPRKNQGLACLRSTLGVVEYLKTGGDIERTKLLLKSSLEDLDRLTPADDDYGVRGLIMPLASLYLSKLK